MLHKLFVKWYSLHFSFFFYTQDLLTRHKVLVAEFLEQNYDAVIYKKKIWVVNFYHSI